MRASQLIAAADVVDNVNQGLQNPISERQLRPLTKLEPSEQKEAWESNPYYFKNNIKYILTGCFL